jgi:hypothetical protein
MPGRNFGVDVVPVVGAIAGEGRDKASDLIEKGADLRAVVGILGGQRRRDDVAGVGVRGEVQLSPRPASLGAVLLRQPLASATKLQPRAVYRKRGFWARLGWG